MYQAIFFDLDGTLLPMDTHAFMRSYFGALGAFFSDNGYDAARVLAGVKAGTEAMFAYDDGQTTNEQRFWRTFPRFMEGELGLSGDWEALFNRFYDEVFPQLSAGIEPDPDAARAVARLRQKGYRMALTTNPLFPPQATACRLTWTGVDPDAFERVTAYQNSRYAKPSPAYYAENLAALGLRGADVLMVGNDPVEDGAACELGCDLYLVTDHLIERAGAEGDVAARGRGSMADFLRFVEELPSIR